jgi:tetratricopeptide (TPR) repeat protein
MKRLDLALKLNDMRGQAITLNNVGEIFRDLGKCKRASDIHEQVLEMQDQVGDVRRQALTMNNLGLDHAGNGNWKQAIDYYEKGLAVSKEIGDQLTGATIAWNLGLVYEELGDDERAAELMQIRVDYDVSVDHTDCAADAEKLRQIRHRIAERRSES